MTRQVSHNNPRNVKRRMRRDSEKLPGVEREVDELQETVDVQAEMLSSAVVAAKPEPIK